MGSVIKTKTIPTTREALANHIAVGDKRHENSVSLPAGSSEMPFGLL
jgi:hypothetical protein